MNYDHQNSDIDVNSIRDIDAAPECQWIPQCDLLLIPGGCVTCDYMRDDVLWDEDGELIAILDEPQDPA